MVLNKKHKMKFILLLFVCLLVEKSSGLHRFLRNANPAGIVFGLTERATEKVLEIPVDAEEQDFGKITRTRATQAERG